MPTLLYSRKPNGIHARCSAPTAVRATLLSCHEKYIYFKIKISLK